MSHNFSFNLLKIKCQNSLKIQKINQVLLKLSSELLEIVQVSQ